MRLAELLHNGQFAGQACQGEGPNDHFGLAAVFNYFNYFNYFNDFNYFRKHLLKDFALYLRTLS